MIGGGRGAFIGAVHRVAARMDGQAELVAGAFSSDPERSRASAADLFIAPERAYGSYQEMAAVEARLRGDRRLDFVVIVTPNNRHFAPAKLFLETGFNVILDKPVTFDLEQALALREIVGQSKKVFVVTHNYTGNAMVKQARELVRRGVLGDIRKYGTKASLEWRQEDPNDLVVKHLDQPRQTWRRGNDYVAEEAKRVTRIPFGHPEGYLEAFGNVYREAFRAIAAEVQGEPLPEDLDFPTIADGVQGMLFTQTALESARLGARWVKFPAM